MTTQSPRHQKVLTIGCPGHWVVLLLTIQCPWHRTYRCYFTLSRVWDKWKGKNYPWYPGHKVAYTILCLRHRKFYFQFELLNKKSIKSKSALGHNYWDQEEMFDAKTRKKRMQKSHQTVPLKGQSNEIFCTRFFSQMNSSWSHKRCPRAVWFLAIFHGVIGLLKWLHGA